MHLLKKNGIEVLILDFDGVLAPHGEDQPLPALAPWLASAVALFTAERIFILTNRPSAARAAYFAQHYPGLQLITGVRQKPYPDGLLKIQALAQMPARQMILYDDRLLTGALAACLAGCQIGYIRQPSINLRRHPLKELFFIALRKLECRFIQWP